MKTKISSVVIHTDIRNENIIFLIIIMTHKSHDKHENTFRQQINSISVVFFIKNKDNINVIV